MKNFFEFFGFLSTACISGLLVFMFIGRAERKGGSNDLMTSEKNIASESVEAGFGSSRKKGSRELPDLPKISRNRSSAARETSTAAPSSEVALSELYNDADFVNGTVKKWKGAVAEAAEAYSLKPQVLMAHVLVQSYLGDYSKVQLNRDAAKHAGEQVMSVEAAAKRYPNGWSVKNLIRQYALAKYFPEAMEAAADTRVLAPMERSSFASTAKGTKTAKTLPKLTNRPTEKRSSAREEGFQKMVAKEMGVSDWKTVAQNEKAKKKVKMLATASRIK